MPPSSAPIEYAQRLTANEIRLVKIAYGNGSKIACTISTYELTGALQYIALSYTWGDATEKHTAVVNNKSVALTLSAYSALRRLRSHFTRSAESRSAAEEQLASSLVWIDALCINQNDVVERNEQVRLMGSIYSAAMSVLIYLGNQEPLQETWTAAAARKVRAVLVLDDPFADEPETFSMMTVDAVKVAQGKLPATLWYDWHLPLALTVLQKPWFKRVWVLQEAALARDASVLYGNEVCRLQDLLALKDVAFADEPSIRITARSFVRFQRLVEPLRHIMIARSIAASSDPPSHGAVSSDEFATMLTIGRARLCQDPKDHVYGLLGMLRGMSSEHITVDYSASVAEVFIQATRALMLFSTQDPTLSRLGSRQLDFLCMLHREHRDQTHRQAADRLPSWVPDWSFADDDARAFNTSMYRAGGLFLSRNPGARFSNDGRSIQMTGYILGSIARAESNLHDLWTADNRLQDRKPFKFTYNGRLKGKIVSHEFWQSVDSFLVQHGDVYKGRLNRQTACYRTLHADVMTSIRTSQSMGSSTAANISRSRRMLATDIPMDEISDLAGMCGRTWEQGEMSLSREEWLALPHTLPHNSLLLLSSGHVGMGRTSMHEDDLLVISPGVGIPLVLRKQDLDTTYQMIGPAYIHGVMDGEVMRAQATDEIPLQDFVIV